MPENVLAALQGYVEAPPGDGDLAFTPFLLDWPEIRAFFEEAQRNDARSIGQETRSFYALQEEGLLTDSERAYLDELETRGRNPTRNETDEEFFASHSIELRQEARLSALWDRFIFGPEVSCNDFVDGLLQCLRRLRQDTLATRRVLVVEGRERAKANFLGLNDDVCRMFTSRYRGLEGSSPRTAGNSCDGSALLRG